MSSIDQVWESDWRLFTEVSQDTILLLVKATAHTRMKAIGGKITVKTSATSDVGRLTKSLKMKKKKIEDEDEQFDLSTVLCQQVWRCILGTWGVSLDRETLE